MIPSDQLSLSIKNTIISLTQTNRPIIRSTYDIVAPAFDALVATATFAANIDRFDQFEYKDGDAYRQALSWFASVKEWHKAQDALNDYSFHDAALVLNYWAFTKPQNLWILFHPISGTYTDVELPINAKGRPTIKGRLAAIVSRVLPPTTWAWATSDSPEFLTVHCIPVSNADSYNVYADLSGGNFTLLGSVPDHTSNTISVPAGFYNVRIAPVENDTVGILSNTIQVNVTAINGEAAAAMSFSAPTTSTPTPTIKQRLLKWLKDRR